MLNIHRSAYYKGIIVPATSMVARSVCAIPFSRFFVGCESVRVGQNCHSFVRVFWSFSYLPHRFNQLFRKELNALQTSRPRLWR